MTFFIFGDSNSARWGSTPRPTELPWSSRYGTRLVGEVAASALIRNYAIGGQRMHYCKGQSAVPGVSWPAIETYAPDVVASNPLPDKAILCAGTNDLPVETTPDAELQDLYTSYEVLDELMRNLGVTLYVVGVVPMRVTGMVSQTTYNQREPRRQALNQRLRTTFGPRFLDPTVLQDSSGQLATAYSYTDGLHISDYAHDVLARALPLAWGDPATPLRAAEASSPPQDAPTPQDAPRGA